MNRHAQQGFRWALIFSLGMAWSWASQPNLDLLAQFRLKRKVLQWFHQQSARSLDSKIELNLSEAYYDNSHMVIDGGLCVEVESLRFLDTGLLKDVPLQMNLKAQNLKIRNTTKEIEQWSLASTHHGKVFANLLISRKGLTRIASNILSQESRIKDFQLDLEEEKLWIRTQIKGGLGGVAVDLCLGVEHNGTALSFVKQDMKVRAWGLGKAKVGEVHAKLKELLSQASFHLPKELLQSLPGLEIQKLKLGSDGLRLHLSLKNTGDYRLVKAKTSSSVDG